MKRNYSYLILIFFLASCQKLLMPTVTKNTPSGNFEAMWKRYDEWYGLFEVKKINWDSLHAAYQTHVNDQMDNAELYQVLTSMITPLNDPHVFIQPTTNGLLRYESSRFFRDNKMQQDFSINVIKEHYLPSLVTIDNDLHYGILPGNIGYIHFGAFGMPVSFYRLQLDKIMEALKNTKAMIVDIRNHGGGDDQVSRYVAGRFAAESKLFMTTRKRNGPQHTNFTQQQNWYVTPHEAPYTHPVALLTTRWTASAGETFTWAMNTQQYVKQIGDTTAGGFSDIMTNELPNGWLYFISIGDYRNAAGESEESKGIAPLFYIVNTPENTTAGKDNVLERAIQILQ